MFLLLSPYGIVMCTSILPKSGLKSEYTLEPPKLVRREGLGFIPGASDPIGMK